MSLTNQNRINLALNRLVTQIGIVETLLQPVSSKVYFAGEALSSDNGATVLGAAESAYSMVEMMLAG